MKAEVVKSRGEYCLKTLLFIITYKPQHRAENNTRILPANELERRKPIIFLPPKMTITIPKNPSIMPINLFLFISSRKNIILRTKTNKGFVANKTEAIPEEVY